MNLPNEIIGGGLIILSISVALLVRYALIWRADIRSTQMRLMQIEEEVQRHPKTCPVKQQIEDMMHPRLILPEKNSPDSMEMIRHYIHIYHSTFMDILARHTCEKLTPSDELLCMMLKLEYNNKEIASILSITTNSVITARYRLKKKLSLAPNQQIDEWIQGIGREEKTKENNIN